MSEGQRLLINIVLAILFGLLLTEIWSLFPEIPYIIKAICSFLLMIAFLMASDWVKNGLMRVIKRETPKEEG